MSGHTQLSHMGSQIMPRERESVKEELMSGGFKKKVLYLREEEVKVPALGLASTECGECLWKE